MKVKDNLTCPQQGLMFLTYRQNVTKYRGAKREKPAGGPGFSGLILIH